MTDELKSKNDQTIIAAVKLLMQRAHLTACERGWWEDRDQMQAVCDQNGFGELCRKLQEAQLIALTHSELSEGLEGLRKDLADDHIPEFPMIAAEQADAIIRICDHAQKYGYDLPGAIIAKMRYNSTRPIRHGGKAF